MKLKDIFSCDDFLNTVFPYFIYEKQNEYTKNELIKCFDEDKSEIEIFKAPKFSTKGLVFSIDSKMVWMTIIPGRDGLEKSWIRESTISLFLAIVHKNNIKLF